MYKRVTGFLLSCVAAAIAVGQSTTPENKPVPRTADGKPDLNGLWGPDRTFIYDITSTLKKGEALPIQPWAEKVTKERMSNADPEARCLPAGVPRMAPYPWKIVQQPKLVVFLFEGNIHTYRQILMDGRGHPDDPDPTWYGHSIGKWEGDTLVVDTTNFKPGVFRNVSTDKLHVVERFTRTGPDTLQWQLTIDDPGAWTKPWTAMIPLRPSKKAVYEYACHEGNYGLESILAGARREDKAAEETSKPK